MEEAGEQVSKSQMHECLTKGIQQDLKERQAGKLFRNARPKALRRYTCRHGAGLKARAEAF